VLDPAAAPAPRATVRVYADPAQARQAIQALQAAGLPAEAISVLSRSPETAADLERSTGVDDDLEVATARRHPLEDVVDWLGRLESVAVPGFGAVLGTGNLWQDIAPAAGRRGAITGALVGLGIPVDEADRLEQAVLRNGELLLVIHTDSSTVSPDRLRAILEAS
jgi:hypothetical protein